ncbi:hypothetical protein GIB67_034271 [Kingdonia uniflora]|uniref:Uncharacterized protein n=1 Tax=Kingdonia uniflora TaxID=39325 RepID=A0A7J7NRT5_9MAGN|nr:hypothetical protein GIB67_034271 [Kingdonia uniflora]
MLKSSRSKDNEKVVTLMRGVYVINDSNRQEAQPKKTNPNPKPIPRVKQIKEWGFAELFNSDEQNYEIEVEVISDCEEIPVFEQFETTGVVENNASVTRFEVEPENGNPNLGLPHIAGTVVREVTTPKTQHQISEVINSNVGSSRSDNRGGVAVQSHEEGKTVSTIAGAESEVIRSLSNRGLE